MIARVYVDTSVIGGLLDEEFRVPTSRLFEDFKAKRFRPVISIVTLLEIEGAPKAVQALLVDEALRDHDFVDLSSEAEFLAEQYLRQGVIPTTSVADAQHIAIATISRVDLLVSWNFKHIVKISRIRGFNAVNLMNGYQVLEIRSPMEVYYEED